MGLRLVLYISESNMQAEHGWVPKPLVDIMAKARESNQQHDITGILAFKAPYFMQIIEGPSPAVRKLLGRIHNDSRHRNVSTVIEKETDHRLFPKSPMRLIGTCSRSEGIVKFLESEVVSDIECLREHGKRLKHFYDFSDFNASSDIADSYADAVLHLNRWPRLTDLQLDLQIEAMEVCGLLTQQHVSYEDLVGKNILDENALINLLDRFKEQDLLQSSKQQSSVDFRSNSPVEIESGRAGFYSRMRSFLKTQLKNVNMNLFQQRN